ncbi:MAG: hypothetical protein WEB58_04385 [Planctomycetaceae bacterium]
MLASFDDNLNHTIWNIGGGIAYVAVALLLFRPALHKLQNHLTVPDKTRTDGVGLS